MQHWCMCLKYIYILPINSQYWTYYIRVTKWLSFRSLCFPSNSVLLYFESWILLLFTYACSHAFSIVTREFKRDENVNKSSWVCMNLIQSKDLAINVYDLQLSFSVFFIFFYPCSKTFPNGWLLGIPKPSATAYNTYRTRTVLFFASSR